MAMQDQVPAVERSPWGILALILNIVVSGVGSIVAGAKASDTKTIIIGIIQLVLWITIIAWIWSIVWGILIFQKSTTAPATAPAAA